MNEVLKNASNKSALHGTPEVQQLATLLSSTRDTLVNQTTRLFLNFDLIFQELLPPQN
ncbi:hypothetical protein RND71_009791 [Anisodus tanguticus]|uniref:Uncharacterized protein n=1 Tax=Anisodus tanguticus TaxID=243964 RepID=A0AAE1VN88_9SOLA|nr:hypothetical protein RND71_009791 [Anisodus tanguticus]